jgi:hypothetical protein
VRYVCGCIWASRSNIDLPGAQQQLIDAIKATGKPFAGS